MGGRAKSSRTACNNASFHSLATDSCAESGAIRKHIIIAESNFFSIVSIVSCEGPRNNFPKKAKNTAMVVDFCTLTIIWNHSVFPIPVSAGYFLQKQWCGTPTLIYANT